MAETDADLLKNGDPGAYWNGEIGHTFAESVPFWPDLITAPASSPMKKLI